MYSTSHLGFCISTSLWFPSIFLTSSSSFLHWYYSKICLSNNSIPQSWACQFSLGHGLMPRWNHPSLICILPIGRWHQIQNWIFYWAAAYVTSCLQKTPLRYPKMYNIEHYSLSHLPVRLISPLSFLPLIIASTIHSVA